MPVSFPTFAGTRLILRQWTHDVVSHAQMTSSLSPSYVGAPRCPIPATGPGADTMQTKTKYVIEGVLLDRGLSANNGSLYHLELTTQPSEARSREAAATGSAATSLLGLQKRIARGAHRRLTRGEVHSGSPIDLPHSSWRDWRGLAQIRRHEPCQRQQRDEGQRGAQTPAPTSEWFIWVLAMACWTAPTGERPNINDRSPKVAAVLAGLSPLRGAYITMTVAPIRARL